MKSTIYFYVGVLAAFQILSSKQILYGFESAVSVLDTAVMFNSMVPGLPQSIFSDIFSCLNTFRSGHE